MQNSLFSEKYFEHVACTNLLQKDLVSTGPEQGESYWTFQRRPQLLLWTAFFHHHAIFKQPRKRLKWRNILTKLEIHSDSPEIVQMSLGRNVLGCENHSEEKLGTFEKCPRLLLATVRVLKRYMAWSLTILLNWRISWMQQKSQTWQQKLSQSEVHSMTQRLPCDGQPGMHQGKVSNVMCL